ncbi:hypothetical protein BGW80DRAFT_1294389 [Lactifluus volemus]|nr:hypothetical protein BGW80DRAFT_1294389 [Lactifluus volemus]
MHALPHIAIASTPFFSTTLLFILPPCYIFSVTLLLSSPAMASGVPLGSGGLLGYVKTYPYPYPTVTLPSNPRGLRYPC